MSIVEIIEHDVVIDHPPRRWINKIGPNKQNITGLKILYPTTPTPPSEIGTFIINEEYLILHESTVLVN